MARSKKSFSDKIARTNKQLFVGRETHVQFFQENIKKDPDQDGFTNIINIYGQGGVGKSTLTNRYLNIAETEKCYTAFVDTEDLSLREVTATMNAIAETFAAKHPFKGFTKRYKDYLQEKGKLEADPERPKGNFGKLVSAGVKAGMKATASFVPDANLVTNHIPIDALCLMRK